MSPPRDRPVTDEELAEWERVASGATPLEWEDSVSGKDVLRLIAAVREARTKLEGVPSLDKNILFLNEELEKALAKLAEIRAVVKEYERHGDLDPQYMVIREVKAVFGE